MRSNYSAAFFFKKVNHESFFFFQISFKYFRCLLSRTFVAALLNSLAIGLREFIGSLQVLSDALCTLDRVLVKNILFL